MDVGLFGEIAPGEFDGVVVFESEEERGRAGFGGDELVKVEEVAVEADDIHTLDVEVVSGWWKWDWAEIVRDGLERCRGRRC